MSRLPSLWFPTLPIPLWFLLSPHQGLPSVLPPLPKRPALEKANGATTMFNAGVFQYQQALANMQFQQQAAFIPSGKARAFVALTPSLVAAKSHPVAHKHPWLCFGIQGKWLNDYCDLLLVARWKNMHGLVCTYSMSLLSEIRISVRGAHLNSLSLFMVLHNQTKTRRKGHVFNFRAWHVSVVPFSSMFFHPWCTHGSLTVNAQGSRNLSRGLLSQVENNNLNWMIDPP